MSDEDYPDINDTLREEGADAARARFDEAHRRRKAAEQANGQPRDWLDVATKPSNKPPPLEWLNMSNWDDEARPEREWAILNRVPLRQAGLFSGEGGAGKSIIEMAKDVAHVAGKDWLGSLPEPGPAFYIGAEDDEKEIHIRFYDIAKHYGVTFKELIEGGLRVLCMLGRDATLCAATGKSGRVETTALYRQIYEAAGDLKPKNISIDTLSRAFAGNEIDRVQVYAFAMHMQALAMVANGSVTVLSHPSLQGIASGTGISGSTAWHGAFRFRQYLKGAKAEDGEQPDGDLRELEFKKNQYGPTSESVVLRYTKGMFLPVPGMASLERLAAEAEVDRLFLTLLRRLAEQGRNVSDKVSSAYAPSVFASEPEAKAAKASKKTFTEAMSRLFAAGKIKVATEGRPSHQRSRIVESDRYYSAEESNVPSNGRPTPVQRCPTGGGAHTPYNPHARWTGQEGVGRPAPPNGDSDGTKAEIYDIGRLLSGWRDTIPLGESLTVDRLIAAAEQAPAFKTELLAIAPLGRGNAVSNILLGRWLRNNDGIECDGLRIEREPGHEHVWRLVETGGAEVVSLNGVRIRLPPLPRTADGYEILCPELDGVPCRQCGESHEPEGERLVHLIRLFKDAQGEPLHEDCAGTWFGK